MKKEYRTYCLLSFLVLITVFLESCAQTIPDPVLLKQIAKIKAIDNHSHMLPVCANQDTEEEPNDLLGQPWFDKPVNVRFDNPHWIGAWRDLYGYKYNDMEKEHLSLLFKEKQRIKREQGVNYPTWVLDKLGIETALVNAAELGLGQTPPRFYLVKYTNDFLYPSSHMLYPYSNTGDIKPAATLEEYIKTVVTPALESFKQEGAMAIKFTTAYLRPLNFEKISSGEAASLYEQLLGEKEVSISEQRKLEDYLFRYITQEAGRLDLKVHIHTGIGANPYFNVSGSNPMLLESVFNDPDQRNTKFVIIHGGWPFEEEAGVMLMKPNVYADFSAQTFLRSPYALSKTLRAWLEWYPEKVLFGTDANAQSPSINWEEYAWLSTKTARIALAIALTEMMNDGQISRNRAFELAKMVLRTNAIRLYDLKLKAIEKGVDVSLHFASCSGALAKVKTLIEQGADINATDEAGKTALHYAANNGHRDVIEFLVGKGADLSSINKDGLTPVECAMMREHRSIVELMVARGAEVSVHIAAYLGDIDKVSSFIESGVPVDARDKMKGLTTLTWAAESSLELVKLLIAKGADVNAKDKWGWTPLDSAASVGRGDIAELLINKDADVNSRYYWGETPLIWAAQQGHKAVAELLIIKGADINARDNAGHAALWHAQDKGHTEIVELLRKHGAKE